MNEQEIAAELARRTEEPVVQPAPNPNPVDDPSPQNFVDKITPESHILKQQIMDYFDISVVDRHDPRTTRSLESIYEWIDKEVPSKDINSILAFISEHESMLGSKLNGQRVKKLNDFIKIRQLRQDLQNREVLLYG